MESLRAFKNGIIKRTIFFAIPVAVVLSSHFSSCAAFLLGLSVGLLNFHLLSRDVSNMTVLPQKRFTSILMINYFLRYGMIGLAIVCAITYSLSVPYFCIGLFFIQGVIIINTLFIQRQVA